MAHRTHTPCYGLHRTRHAVRMTRRHISGRFDSGTTLIVPTPRAPRPARRSFRFMTLRHGLAYARHNQRAIARNH